MLFRFENKEYCCVCVLDKIKRAQERERLKEIEKEKKLEREKEVEYV